MLLTCPTHRRRPVILAARNTRGVRRLARVTVVAVVSLAGCSSSASTVTPTTTTVALPTDTNGPTVSTVGPSVSATTEAVPTTSMAAAADGAVTEADLVRFIEATESVLSGTSWEGAVYGAPEIYIALAQSACARFTNDQSFEVVAADLLTAVAGADANDDDERLVGALLGAATRTICPEHADLV